MRLTTLKLALGCVVMAACVFGSPVRAATVTFLGIEGELGAGGAGTYPLDAAFSWISHRLPGNETGHIWTLAPGTDGGMRIGSAQPGTGEITAVRAMYNLSSWLYSVDGGPQFDPLAEVFDLSSIRLYWGGTTYDFGGNALAPLVGGADGVTGANGWWREGTTGRYHLVFRGGGQCDGCELTVHLTGQLTAVPLPPAAWLFGAGLLVLVRSARCARLSAARCRTAA